MNRSTHQWKTAFPWEVCFNLLLVLACYMLCRVVFIAVNWDIFSTGWSTAVAKEVFKGGLIFDLSAIAYTNLLYLVLMLLPLHWKERAGYRQVVRWVYVVINAVCLVSNLIDTVYFTYTQHRSTAYVFEEFKNENNLSNIFFVELKANWYLLLLAIFFVWLLAKGYRHSIRPTIPRGRYYLQQSLWLIGFVPFIISGIRGAWITNNTRPIAISNAFLYVQQSTQASIVLNTPFSIIRTLTEKPLETPQYFDADRLASLYTMEHYPATDSLTVRKKNVVILIVESFAQEFVGGLNKGLDGGTYKGYTQFVDSLLPHCLTWEQTFCNTYFSIDAVPAILASIPRMDKPFPLTPFALNKVTGIANELGRWGYHTAFFHGAERQSLGIHAFAKNVGFANGYAMEDYKQDSRFGGEKDFDGNWGIWDEPFLQYFCTKMGEMPEPFCSAVFTLSSHHPFILPDNYKEVFLDEGRYPLHKCIRYTDHALRRFFQTASQQPWYQNTLFVLTADHASSRTTHAEYKTELGGFRVPIIFFDPSGELPREMAKGVAQQIDIMPTLLNYLGYPYPYIAFGKDLFRAGADAQWAMNWDRIPQYIWGDYLLQFDGQKATALYQYVEDPLLKNNLLGQTSVEEEMTNRIKAFIQTFMDRMSINDVLNPTHTSTPHQ